MRILVTGATGFLGRAIVAAGAQHGHEVIAASRGGSSVRAASEKLATGDLTQTAAYLDLKGVDAIINCAARVHVMEKEPIDVAQQAFRAMNTDMPVALAEAARRDSVGRFVQLSSVAAVASSTANGEILSDASDPAPTTAYGQSKLAADTALGDMASADFRVACLRPPALYGHGVGAHFAQLMKAAQRGVPIPLGAINNLRSFAYVENIADAAIAALNLVQSGSFLVTDGPPISSAQLYRKLLTEYDQPDRTWPWPEPLIRLLAKAVLGDRAESLLGNAAFDGGRFAQELSWQPPMDMDQALRATIAKS